MIRTLQLSLHLQDCLTFRQEHIDDADRFGNRTATIITQIEDKTLGSLLSQIDKSTAHILGTLLGKGIEVDVTDATLQHAIIRQERQLDGTACYLHLHRLACTWTLNFQHERRTRITTKMIADIAHLLIGHILIINTQNDIALLQSHFCSRHILVRLTDADALQLEVVAYHRTYTRILAGEQILEFLHFLLRIIGSIRVEATQHGIDTISDHNFSIERIYIHQIKILVDGIEYFHILCGFEVMVFVNLGKSWSCKERHKQGEQYSFHCYLI